MAAKVWIVDDDSSIRWVLERALTSEGFGCRTFEDGESLLASLNSDFPEVILSDIRMPGIDGLSLLQLIQEKQPEVPVIIMTAHSDLDSAVNAYQSGAFEYLPKPFDVDQAVELIRRAIGESMHQSGASEEEGLVPEILGQAPAMQEVFRAIGRLAHSHATGNVMTVDNNQRPLEAGIHTDLHGRMTYAGYLQRRRGGEPVAYILGQQGFWKIDLEVAPHTLIPRPDTELLVETALELQPAAPAKVLDLGTGTGAIALALAYFASREINKGPVKASSRRRRQAARMLEDY